MAHPIEMNTALTFGAVVALMLFVFKYDHTVRWAAGNSRSLRQA